MARVAARRRRLLGVVSWLARVLLIVVVVGYLGGSGYVLANGAGAVRETVTAWASLPTAQDSPELIATVPDTLGHIPIWGGKDRITVLLLGVDVRPDEEGDPGRTDFIGVATIDPSSKTAGMISFPRDLWVTIPAGNGRYFEERVNAAFRQGELERQGGGPLMARRTIEYNFGIRTNFYALVDFEGFVYLIDKLGGVTVDVPRPLKDNEYPTPDYGIKRIYYPAGIQEMDGASALEYARSRHQDSDLERNRRQQAVLLAARHKALSLNLLPKLPSLISEIREYVKTDMNPAQMAALARLASNVELEDITLRSLDGRAVTSWNGGASLLLPNRPVIGQIIAEVFGDPRLRREAATVLVMSDPAHRTQAIRLTNALGIRGINARIEERPGLVGPRPETMIVDHAGKPASIRQLTELLQLPGERVRLDLGSDATADIEIRVGDDLKIP